MRHSLLTLALVVAGSVACDLRAPGVVTVGSGGEPRATPQGRSIETFATPLVITAGGSVTVSCVVRRDNTYLPEERTEVVAVPAAASATQNGAQWTLTFTDADADGETHALNCRTADGGVTSKSDVHVQVAPGAAASIDTALSTASTIAGAPVAVSCLVYDGYGNFDEDTRATSLDAAPALMIAPHTASDFTVRGTTAGSYPVACRIGNIIDSSPATLTVTPGIPGRSVTSVDASDVTPTQNVNVSCGVSDAYGNALNGWATTVQVLAADGSPPSQTGLALSDTSFSATRTGVYYVFCSVPGYQAGDESPAIVTVRAGPACTWAYTALDVGECYWQGRTLPFDFAAWDFWGNEIADATTDLIAVPANGVQRDGRGWQFVEEGDFDITLGVSPPLDNTPAHGCSGKTGSVFTPYIANIRVDSSGPQINITSPARAAMMVAGGTADLAVSITGNVSDTLSPIVALELNGAAVPVSGTSLNQALNVSQTSRWGLNIIAGSATDECSNRTVVAQSYLRSGQYFNASVQPDAGSRASQGILAHMNQVVLDDSNRNDLDDIASIAARILLGIDFNALVPPGTVLASDPLRSGCSFCQAWNDTGYTVKRRDDPNQRIYWEGPYLNSLSAVDGGMNFSISLTQFDFPLWAQGVNRTCACGVQATVPVSADGWAGADRVDATGTLGITLSGNQPSVTVANLNVNASGLYLNIDCGLLTFVCDAITGLVIPWLKSTIENKLADEIRARIPPLVSGFLTSFSLDTNFTLPPPMSSQLSMSSGLDWILFCGPNAGLARPAGCPASSPNPGYGQLGLFTQVYPLARDADIPSGSRGAIRKDGALPALANGPYAFGMGLKDDMFNQILWSVWYAGALDLPDVTQLLGSAGVPGVNMSFFANLPPVVMPGRGGSQIDIGLGDVYIDASVDLGQLLGGGPGTTINVGLFLSMVAGASISITPTNELLVTVDPNAQIVAQVVSIDDPGYQGLMSDLFTDLLSIVAPNLIASVFSAFPIPEFDLSGVGGMPAGTVWRLSGASVARSPDYYRLTGSLQ